jgi:predicted alpha/beta-hydrolase family hydrolase
MTAGALLLFPGAGSSRTHSSLVAIERAVEPLPVVRADFPYRKAGRSGPDRPPILLATVRDEAAALVAGAHIRANRLVVGGRSMGGRICSMAVADGLPAAGLVLISYPLHPPGKPEQLRVEHLPRIEVPCLFISGTSDPFGTPDELEQATATIPGCVEHLWIQSGRHELKGKDAEIADRVAKWIKSLPGASRR